MDTTDMEANREKSHFLAEQQDEPKEGAAVEIIRALLRPIWGPASSRRAQPTAEETDPRDGGSRK
jgi:hypothetical protein